MQYAFCDEYGAFGFKFEKENVSTHFIICAIIINEEDLETVKKGAEHIRRIYFQTGEMKSKRIRDNHPRRIRILKELMKLPFHIYAFVADKRKIGEQSGLRFKGSFYKFLNQCIYNELHNSFQELTIVADETGRNEFMKSFSDYVKNHNKDLTLFDEFNFQFNKSDHNVLIQIADLVAGSLAYSFDEKKKQKANGSNYKSFFKPKILGIQTYPLEYQTYKVREHMPNENEVDKKIAEICYRKALAFKQQYDDKDADENTRMQISVLNYLLFRFMNNHIRTYIPTTELINDLQRKGFRTLSKPIFRNKIIAKLRDYGVIIASSPKGYKIPSKKKEIEDFIDHGQSIIEPMISRLRLCFDTINLGSNGQINVLDSPKYSHIKYLIGDEREQETEGTEILNKGTHSI